MIDGGTSSAASRDGERRELLRRTAGRLVTALTRYYGGPAGPAVSTIDVLGQPPRTAVAPVPGFGVVVLHAGVATAGLVRRVSRAHVTGDGRCIIVCRGAERAAMRLAADWRVRLFRYREHPLRGRTTSIAWERSGFTMTLQGAVTTAGAHEQLGEALRAAVERENGDRLLVLEPGRRPRTLACVFGELALEFDAELDDHDQLRFVAAADTLAVYTRSDLPPVPLIEARADLMRTGREARRLHVDLDRLLRFRLDALDGFSADLDVDAALTAEPALERTGETRCHGCWKPFPRELGTRRALHRERVRPTYLLSVAPVAAQPDALLCPACATAVGERDLTALRMRRFAATLAVAESDLFDARCAERHLACVHAALLDDDAPYEHEQLDAFDEETVDRLAVEARMLIERARTSDVLKAFVPAVYADRWDAKRLYGASFPWAQLRYALAVLASSPEPVTPGAFDGLALWTLRGTVEAMFEARFRTLSEGTDAVDLITARTPENVVVQTWLASQAAGPRGTVQQLVERFFNLGLRNPDAVARAFSGLSLRSVLSVLLHTANTFVPGALDLRATLSWALSKAVHGADRKTYHRLWDGCAPLGAIDVDLEPQRRLLDAIITRRGSSAEPYYLDEPNPAAEYPWIVQENGDVSGAPFSLVLEALTRRLEARFGAGKLGKNKGAFHEARIAAALGRLAGYTVHADVRWTGADGRDYQQDFVVVCGDTVLCIEAKDRGFAPPSRNLAHGVKNLHRTFKAPREALEQAKRFSDWVRANPRHPDVVALGLNPSSAFVRIAVTGGDYGEMALRPELVANDLPAAAIVMSAEDLENAVDVLRTFGLDGAHLVRYVRERAELHARLRVEAQIDFVNAYVRAGSLRNALRGDGETLLAGGVDRFAAIYRCWFTGDDTELRGFTWDVPIERATP